MRKRKETKIQQQWPNCYIVCPRELHGFIISFLTSLWILSSAKEDARSAWNCMSPSPILFVIWENSPYWFLISFRRSLPIQFLCRNLIENVGYTDAFNTELLYKLLIHTMMVRWLQYLNENLDSVEANAEMLNQDNEYFMIFHPFCIVLMSVRGCWIVNLIWQPFPCSKRSNAVLESIKPIFNQVDMNSPTQLKMHYVRETKKV